MWPKERHQRILSLLSNNQLVSANDLAEFLSVSRETVRRDLLELENSGLIDRVHGGAVLANKGDEAPFEKRKNVQTRAKQDIARKAVSLIKPGESIMVDAGTTTSAFGHYLAKLAGIMVVTNSIDIAQTIKASGADIDLILLGGQLTSDVPATYGELTLSEIQRFNVNLAFISPVAIDADKGVFSYALKEAEVAKAMISKASKSVILSDHSKIGETNRVRFAETNEINYLITDNKVKPEQLKPFEKTGVEIISEKSNKD
ncbi:DeoR/GlpR family DNA-binding transcription regulator [Cocleimonas sp. KMM 6892]|uniref:DeoR/GlpR family DNA-binding transcription regulator n=1 Tax=unclassified Cocleimonas TaxID=2639732 RepID=UPI002DB64E12|nr:MULTISPECIES: DeoR/GlpR family DNA-binding transcription regulator [unclassified Cocleimonas]MEB8431432.1 DeoR/GlpR family DNA-binding transcription regulator [Cocleimonas sp. KMM 6892]MEC4713796.1 DeoR/GlpR family DNA-binding transcription regulator [Cocleimonas sp. KMM 6895]MEC4743127.1 DeoR/GlpR family DNA-binding transcription regulator [Cocleimonas sp. KMM 6896]